ncbi:MAG: hypothetical protein HYV60_17130 [Planctomycetia bacterium]|nr:hypothetical protein [Planctomycetia bacterium]
MTNQDRTNANEVTDAPRASNAIRLSVRDWVVATSIALSIMVLTPVVWKYLEPFDPPTDFRVPYDLSDDYWTYQQHVDRAIKDDRIPIIGDSVVWGEYVDPRHTLSYYLNELHGETRFANGGLNGAHPLALQGLVRHYAKNVRDRPVILHCNLLWMSSVERDLQTDKEVAFNHPRLVPQFVPRMACYKAPAAERMGIVIDQHLSLRTWVHHLRVADFDGLDVHSWTLEHPYANLFERISLPSTQPKDEPHSLPLVWTERGIQPQDIPWINLDTSLQWQAFRTTVQLLRDRGNRVFVIVGPFNEHMLTADSRERYGTVSRQVESWLDEEAIPCFAAAPLPSGEYADASHPLSAGYTRLAEQVSLQADFQRWLGGRP